MSISRYHSAILKDLDVLEGSTKNAYIQSCLDNIRKNVKELYTYGRNYRDALAYINGITNNVNEDMLDDLTPADFKDAFSDVSIDDENSEMFYNADLVKEALDRGDISKDSDGSYYSNKGLEGSFEDAEKSINDDLERRFDSLFGKVNKSKEEVKQEPEAIPDFMQDGLEDGDIPDSVFDFTAEGDHYDFYEDMKALFQKESPDRLAFLRSTREPTIVVKNEPIEIDEEFMDEVAPVEEPEIEESSEEPVEDIGVSLDDFIVGNVEERKVETAPEEEEFDLYDEYDGFLSDEELAEFDS